MSAAEDNSDTVPQVARSIKQRLTSAEKRLDKLEEKRRLAKREGSTQERLAALEADVQELQRKSVAAVLEQNVDKT